MLGQRTLNRALLARQHLIERARSGALIEVEYLVGMQAQIPQAPYVGLWSRLEGFKPQQLSALIENRKAVRLGLLRNTLHLVSGRDCLTLWPLFQTLFQQRLRASPFAAGLKGADLDAVMASAGTLLRAKPMTLAALGAALHEEFPRHPANDLAYAMRHLVPLIQVPPRGLWRRSAQPTWSTAEIWLGQPAGSRSSVDALILRYLGAFGPASVADFAAWSDLSGSRTAFERLRKDLLRFRDDRGRELFDLPDAPRPDARTPVPPRFLPEYDNLLLGHQDRTRVIAFEHRHVILNGTFLVDGIVAGIWTIAHEKDQSRLTISAFKALGKRDRVALGDEGERLLMFAAPTAKPTIDFLVAPPRS